MNRGLARTSPLLVLTLLGVALLAGCATAPTSRETRGGPAPRVRCLSDSARDTAEGSRPLFFLFCVESP